MDQPAKKLTAKQRIFAQEYARTCNGAESARRAGVKPGRAKKSAWKWLNDPAYDHVAEYVDELLADASAQRKIDHDILRQFLRGRLELDTRGYFYPAKDEQGNPHPRAGKLKDPHDLDWHQAQYLQARNFTEYGTDAGEDEETEEDGEDKPKRRRRQVQSGNSASIKWTDANKAADMLAKSSGFYLKDLGPNEADDKYRQADQELDGLLEELDDDEGESDEEEASEEEASGEGSAG